MLPRFYVGSETYSFANTKLSLWRSRKFPTEINARTLWFARSATVKTLSIPCFPDTLFRPLDIYDFLTAPSPFFRRTPNLQPREVVKNHPPFLVSRYIRNMFLPANCVSHVFLPISTRYFPASHISWGSFHFPSFIICFPLSILNTVRLPSLYSPLGTWFLLRRFTCHLYDARNKLHSRR